MKLFILLTKFLQRWIKNSLNESLRNKFREIYSSFRSIINSVFIENFYYHPYCELNIFIQQFTTAFDSDFLYWTLIQNTFHWVIPQWFDRFFFISSLSQTIFTTASNFHGKKVHIFPQNCSHETDANKIEKCFTWNALKYLWNYTLRRKPVETVKRQGSLA